MFSALFAKTPGVYTPERNPVYPRKFFLPLRTNRMSEAACPVTSFPLRPPSQGGTMSSVRDFAPGNISARPGV